MQYTSTNALVQWVKLINVELVKRAWNDRKKWMKKIRKDMDAKGPNEDILIDRNEWKKLIHALDMT